MEQSNSKLFSKDILDFVTVSVEYCNFIENCNKLKAFDFASALIKILPITYLKASLIPIIDSDSESQNEDFVTEEIYNFIQDNISKLLSANDTDCIVPETSSQNGENTNAPISEILTDIYQDLKNFSMNYKTNNEIVMNESLYICKQNFEEFWGERLLSSMISLHKLLYKDTDWETNINNNNNEHIKTDNWIFTKRQQEWNNEF